MSDPGISSRASERGEGAEVISIDFPPASPPALSGRPCRGVADAGDLMGIADAVIEAGGLQVVA